MELSCLEGAQYYGTIVYYSHLIPLFIAIILAIFVLIKSQFSLLAKIFSLFVGAFSLWLIGDNIAWLYQNYHVVAFTWSLLDYLNILFYLFGAYFFFVFIKGRDVSLWSKVIFFALSLPAWAITFSGNSITAFYQPYCEAYNNEWLTNYKFFIEIASIAFIVVSGFIAWLKPGERQRKQIVIIALALILFFITFSLSEYYASVTGIYEINLYALFILPLFLGLITYSIVNLHIFRIKGFGTQLLVYVLLIMIGSQFFFLEDATDKILTLITFLLSLFFGLNLLRSVHRELAAKKEIERLAKDLEKSNDRLKELDRQKTEFVSLASHQLRAPLTATKGYLSMMLDGDFGEIPGNLLEPIKRVFTSTNSLIQIVGDFLDVSRIELGTMKYNMTEFDLKKLIDQIIGELRPNIELSGLEFKFNAAGDSFPMHGDSTKLKQVFNNLIDNALKYTKNGFVHAHLEKHGDHYTFEVKDSGVGIHPPMLPKLFDKFVRASNANEANVLGTGLGLFVARQMIEKHGGKIWAESEGEGKGSTFYVGLPIKTNVNDLSKSVPNKTSSKQA